MGAIQITKISHYMKRFFIKRHLVKLLKRKFRNTHQVYYDDNGFLTFKPKPNVTKSSIASRIN